MKKIAILLMILTLISKFVGLIRETILAYLFPTNSAVANAFLISQILPVILVSLFAAGISTSFIPIYNKIVYEKGKTKGDIFTSNTTNISIILVIITIIFLEIFAPYVVNIFAPGFSGYTKELTIKFMRLSLLSMIPSIMSCVFRGYLNANNHFWVQNVQGFIMNFIIIFALVISKKYDNPIIVGIGLLAANIFQYIPYISIVKSKGFKYHKVIDFKDKNIKMIIVLAIPIIIGVAVNQINVMIDKSIATTVSKNGVPILNYAFRLIEFVSGIVITNVSLVSYPQFSKNVIEKNMDGLKDSVMGAMTMISLFVLPATVGLMLFSKPITHLLFFRGEFTLNDVQLTSMCMFFYSISLMGLAIKDILSKSFYSMNDTKTPTINSIWMVVINIIGNLILSKIFGIVGLAISTSIASTIGAIMLIIRFKISIGKFFNVKSYMIDILKMLISSVVMGVLSYLIFELMSNKLHQNIALLLSILIAAISYILLLVLFKVNEFVNIIEYVRKRTKIK